MYDFYPEWGPSRNRAETDARDTARPTRRERYWQAAPAGRSTEPAMVGAAGPEGRDADWFRPDDN